MSKLTQLALASYEMEKAAEEKDTLSRKAARLGGGIAGANYGGKVGAAVGQLGSTAVKALTGKASVIPREVMPKGVGGLVGMAAGALIGAKAGHGLVGDIQKKAETAKQWAGILLSPAVKAIKKHTPTAIAAGVGAHVADKMAVEKKAGLLDIAKGIGSVGLNLAKQNPGVTKLVAGGAAAGAAGAVAKKALSSGQEKQADSKVHNEVTTLGAYAGAGAGVYGAFRAGDAHANAMKAKKGIDAIHSRAAGTSKAHTTLSQADRSSLYKKLEPSAKLSMKNNILSKATFLGEKGLKKTVIGAGVTGAVAGGYAAHKAYNALTKKAGDALLNAKKKSGDTEKETNDGKQETGTKSSLIAAANERMANEV